MLSNFCTCYSLVSMVAAKEGETLKAGVESGTVKMLTVKLMGLLCGLQVALVMERKHGDDAAALNLKCASFSR